MDFLQNFILNTWAVLNEAAPWLLFGLISAGLIKAWLPDDFLARWLGKPGFGSVFRAAIIGTPLPLCSCGVLPAAMTLRKEGASRGATVSFLIATPENGVDSLSMTYVLLGPLMLIIRPIAAFISALFAGMLAELAPEPKEEIRNSATNKTDDGTDNDGCHGLSSEASRPCSSSSSSSPPPTPQPQSSCCSSSPEPEQVAIASCCSSKTEPEPEPQSSCCSSQPKPAIQSSCCSSSNDSSGAAPPPTQPTFFARTRLGLRFAMVDILDDIKFWLSIGILAAGLMNTFIPPDALVQWGAGIGAKFIMLLVGLPMYICAVASTPVAASMILAGVSPGTALVFLMAGPATNLGSVAVVRKAVGTPALIAYLAGISIGALVFGVTTDAIIAHYNLDVLAQVGHAHEMLPQWLSIAAAVLLIFLAIKPLRKLVVS